MDFLAYTPAEFNNLETPAETFTIPARKNWLNKENIFDEAPVCWIAGTMSTNSAFTRLYTENPIWYQQFDLGPIEMLRRGQPIADFHAVAICWLYFTTMKAMNFQDVITSFKRPFCSGLCTSVWFDFNARRYLKLS